MKSILISAAVTACLLDAAAGGYSDDFRALYQELGQNSGTIKIHDIDWQRVGEELLPQADDVASDDEFGMLCIKLVTRLQDSHAGLMSGTSEIPRGDFPEWDAGFACLKDAAGQAVVYYVAEGRQADRKGLKPGMAVVELNGVGIADAIQQAEKEIGEYIGYSTRQYRDYDTYHRFARQQSRGDEIDLVLQDPSGRKKKVRLSANEEVGYIPRLPVPMDGISDGGANIQWTTLKNNIGYIYVRRIQQDLEPELDVAVEELAKTDGIIIDVRANSGGGFDFNTSHYNFDLESPEESGRVKYRKPMAVLISPRCISAGEGWASWFAARERARFFGEPTAGASGRKTTYTLPSGRFKVRYVVKPYKGYLDRYIEGRGLEPDAPVVQTAGDLAKGRDTVLEAAREYLMSL